MPFYCFLIILSNLQFLPDGNFICTSVKCGHVHVHLCMFSKQMDYETELCRIHFRNLLIFDLEKLLI